MRTGSTAPIATGAFDLLIFVENSLSFSAGANLAYYYMLSRAPE